MVYKSGPIFVPFCQGSRMWRTDGQTEFSSLDRVCIACSAVKIRVATQKSDLIAIRYSHQFAWCEESLSSFHRLYSKHFSFSNPFLSILCFLSCCSITLYLYRSFY